MIWQGNMRVSCRLWCVLLCCGMLMACSSTEEVIEPAPLESFKASVKFKKQWQKDIGQAFEDRHLLLMPAVTDESIFAVDPTGRLTAWQRQKGRQIWRHQLKQPVTSGVSVDRNQVYVGFMSGELAAFSQATGEELWRASLAGEPVAPAHSAREYVVVHTINGRIHLLDRTTGQSLWIYEAVLPALTLRGAASPKIEGQQVLVGLANGKLLALDLKTGLVRWERVLGGTEGRSELDRLMDLDSPFWLGDGIVAAGSYQGRVTLLELSRGRPLWSRELSSYSAINGGADAVYVTDDQGVLWALDLRTGRTLWQQSALTARRSTGCALVSGICVVGDFEGYLHAFDQVSGELVGRTRVGSGPIRTVPLVVDDQLYVLNANATLAGVRLVL